MHRRAFNLPDLAAVLVIAIVLLAVVTAGFSEHRRHARLGVDVASLQRLGAATTSYAADHAELLWGISWQANETYLMADEDGNLVPTQMPDTDLEAGQWQGTHLIRVLGDRVGDNNVMPVFRGWLPFHHHGHLALLDYLGEDALARWTTSAADDVQLNWKDDPVGKFDQGAWLPLQPEPNAINRRYPYSSGFELAPAAYAYNQSELSDEVIGSRIQQSGTHFFWAVPSGTEFFGRTMADVTYPAHKVHVFDTHARHLGSHPDYFMIKQGAGGDLFPARIPVLHFDASALVRHSADSNPGWRPNTPTFPCMTFWYQPRPWEPDTANGEFQEFGHGQYRWTRGGLKGLDFSGRPLETGQDTPGECDI